MNISNSQVNRLRHFVRAGLRSLFRPEPQTAVEWADANYYLPKESAYQEGRWETLPFQRAIMNAMGSDYIREVNVVKSARVGYSKMLLGVYAYFIEHKQRNTLIWLPTDGDAENFMKTHVEPTIRDIPSLLALAPWYGKKHRDNTLTMKRFTNGRGFWCLGGKAAKNYREKSVDVAGYDELAAFDDDIEQEGSPTFLGDKRIEGSVWPKSIRGSTPKVRGTCQIERAASESPHFMRFHVACPHCGEEQYLKFGDKETPFGLKWTPDDPSSVFYLCEHNACVIRQQELDFTDARYICEKTGIWTRDGILWFSSSGEEIEPPDSVTFHIWTAYSPFTTWVQIVKDWMKTKGDTGKRKTFVNTTLGETWEAKIGERPDAEVMAERKEHYSAPVMAAVKISGVLKDGAGKPIQNCTIQLKAKRNSTTVLVNTVASENPDEAGRYSMDVEYGQYSVTLLVEGFPPSHAGTITVYEGSRPGTLNDFLGAMTEDDVMPEALRRFEEMVEEAARNAEAASQSAAAAKKSETAAASSKNAAKTSETNAANSAQAAAASQTASANSATAAKKSETNAKNSETAAKTSETNAKSSQTAAK
ncbi:TPA: phage terminase large subunit family protein, partial [Escherichia coli]|nr:phage terminase large subunit family protein [Escherichia coli]